jgi:hypothetical protein
MGGTPQTNILTIRGSEKPLRGIKEGRLLQSISLQVMCGRRARSGATSWRPYARTNGIRGR